MVGICHAVQGFGVPNHSCKCNAGEAWMVAILTPEITQSGSSHSPACRVWNSGSEDVFGEASGFGECTFLCLK